MIVIKIDSILILQEKRRLLSFVVVGGGPTGVEFAAELNGKRLIIL